VLFAIHPRTDRVSVDTNGTAGNGASTEPAISGATGRFVAFTSSATLTPTPGGSGAQIFVHDRQTGQPSLISTNDVGNAGNGASSHPTISATGRYVAFTSVAPNLAPIPGAIDSQIFLRDTLSSTTILVSQDAVGNAGNGASSQPTISADGRYVAFTSSATTLAPTPNGSGTQIFLRDTQGNTTILVSRDASGDAGDGASSQPTISADGRYVAFTSSATTLAPTPNGSGTQIFLRDTQGNTTILVSQDAVGDAGNGASSQPTISADGRYVAVTSVAALAPTPGGSGTQIFRRDTQANATILVSQDAVGNAGNGVSSAASINSNGGLVAFSSAADFALGATGPVDIYIRALP
jgi:Tol biopolymer transport system component